MLRCADISLNRGAFTLRADFSLPAGGVNAVIGPSGGGKSTLIDVIAGFAAPDQGRVFWQETDITTAEPGKRPIAVLFQDQNLFPHLTAKRNVALALTTRSRLRAHQDEKVKAALARVDLSDKANAYPGDLSGGQRARIALARLLLQAKPLLLLDEPFSALGPALRHEMLEMVAVMAKEAGQTVVFVTHDPEEARRADHVIYCEDGIVQPPKTSTAFFAEMDVAVARYLGKK